MIQALSEETYLKKLVSEEMRDKLIFLDAGN
jgi:hypothetical protein